MFSESDLQRLLAQNDQLAVVGEERGRRPSPTLPTAQSAATKAVTTVKEERWTETEKAFARQYLQPALERGEYVWYMAQVVVYMPGQTYTFDFVALRPDGGADHFEVKGKEKLGSQDRSSVKVRWAETFIKNTTESPHRVFWARWGKDERWLIREVKSGRKLHPICR
jgi:hypothetical protein